MRADKGAKAETPLGRRSIVSREAKRYSGDIAPLTAADLATWGWLLTSVVEPFPNADNYPSPSHIGHSMWAAEWPSRLLRSGALGQGRSSDARLPPTQGRGWLQPKHKTPVAITRCTIRMAGVRIPFQFTLSPKGLLSCRPRLCRCWYNGSHLIMYCVPGCW
jgi:hypothetical protein